MIKMHFWGKVLQRVWSKLATLNQNKCPSTTCVKYPVIYVTLFFHQVTLVTYQPHTRMNAVLNSSSGPEPLTVKGWDQKFIFTNVTACAHNPLVVQIMDLTLLLSSKYNSGT